MAEAATRRSDPETVAVGECDELAVGDWPRASKHEAGCDGGVGDKEFVGLLTIGGLCWH